MEKPERLYHGSTNRSIEEFEPRAGNVRDVTEGPRVFATPDKRMASIFLSAERGDHWTRSGAVDGVPYFVISDRERFEKLDQGGAIYHLPSDAFETDPNRGMGDLEWTSRESVRPTEKEEHQSALDAMINHGVQVYFVDAETFAAIDSASDHGISILRTTESENKCRGVNVAEL